MFRIKTPHHNQPPGIEDHIHLTVAMEPRGDFATLSEAIAEVQGMGMDLERTVIEDLTAGEQASVKEWIESTRERNSN
jgi:hypothetical protein